MLNDFAEVDAVARLLFGWRPQGAHRLPTGLWEIGATGCMVGRRGRDAYGDRADLRVRTNGNVAIYGQDSPDYLHPDL